MGEEFVRNIESKFKFKFKIFETLINKMDKKKFIPTFLFLFQKKKDYYD